MPNVFSCNMCQDVCLANFICQPIMWDAFFFIYLLLGCQLMTLVHTDEEEPTPVVTKTPLKRFIWLLRSGKSRIKWTAWNLQVGSFGVYHHPPETFLISSFVQLIIKGKPFWAVHSGKPSSAHTCHLGSFQSTQKKNSGLLHFFSLLLSADTRRRWTHGMTQMLERVWYDFSWLRLLLVL